MTTGPDPIPLLGPDRAPLGYVETVKHTAAGLEVTAELNDAGKALIYGVIPGDYSLGPTTTVPVEEHGAVVPMSRELAEDAVFDFARLLTHRTPEEQAAWYAEHERRRREEHAIALARWGETFDRHAGNLVAEQVLGLHRPDEDCECTGCPSSDEDGYEGWPCDTFRLLEGIES